MIPGIAAFVLTRDTGLIDPSDKAYPWLLHNYVPTGIRGLAFAALAAAIVSSLASMLNSTSTIFTMDIYQKFINKDVSDTKMVNVGRITSFLALIIAVLSAQPLLGNLDQAFQYIQEFTGFVTPGVVVIFCFGLFWKRINADAALAVAVLTIPLSFAFKLALPSIPFIDRMGLVFLLLALIAIAISYASNKIQKQGLELKRSIFKTDVKFNVSAILLSVIVMVLYLLFW